MITRFASTVNHAAGLALAAALACACASADLTPDAGGNASDAAGLADAARGDAAREDAAATAPDAATQVVDAGWPTDAALPDPDGAPPPDAAPCTPVWMQLLINADFDAGASSWTEAGGTLISDSHPLTPHTGAYAARLLGFNGASTALFQSVSIPADATGLRMSGYRCYVTSEPAATPNDNLSIALRETGGAVLETLVSISNANAGATCGWLAFSYTAADAHAGESIDLLFDATADGLYPTSFYYDSLILETLACP